MKTKFCRICKKKKVNKLTQLKDFNNTRSNLCEKCYDIYKKTLYNNVKDWYKKRDLVEEGTEIKDDYFT